MLDTEGRIAEAPTANIFLVKDRCVRTPSDEECAARHRARKVVMDVLEDMKITTAQSPILPGDLSTFDEAFLSGTLRHVQPILRIEDHELDCPGPITRALVDRMHEVYLGRVVRGDTHVHRLSTGTRGSWCNPHSPLTRTQITAIKVHR